MQGIMRAEMRGDEIAFVTPEKAPELLATFNRAYLDASQFFATLKLEQNRAEDAVNKARAVALIDKVPVLIKEKGLTSSADVRQALVEQDADYQAAKERLDMISAMLEYMKGKMKYLENAFTSVKKIMDTGNWSMLYTGKKAQLDGTDDTTKTAGQVQPRFGKPI